MSTSAQPSFVQSAAASDLYWLADGLRCAGYCSSASAAPGASVSLSESFADDTGLWFWLDEAPVSDADFVRTLKQYRTLLPRQVGPRWLWIAGASGALAQWRTQRVDMTRTTDVTVVTAGGLIEVGGIRVMLGAGTRVSVNSLVADGPDWGFCLTGSPGLVFVTGDGLQDAANGSCAISYRQGKAGCLVWTMNLAVGTASQPSDLNRLGAGLRFFGPDSQDPGNIRVLRIEALRQTVPITLFCSFDPLAPLDPARTRLGLLPWGTALTTVPSFDSGYVSARGYSMTLAPRNLASTNPPGFVLAIQPLATGALDGPLDDVPVQYYLTPDGDFDLTAHHQQGQWMTAVNPLQSQDAPVERLLCGTSGLDYIGLGSSSGTVLSFRAGRPAYAPPVVEAGTGQVRRATGQDTTPAALTALGTTAWTWLSSASSVRYYAQAEDAPFYTGGHAGFLDYLEIAAATLASTHADPAFPMVGYAGLAPSQADFARELEARGIAPQRRRQIKWLTQSQWLLSESPKEADPTPSSPVQAAVSPPGLAIGYAGDEQPWAWLAIGNTGAAADGLPDLRFTCVDGAFRQALLTNRLFMVLGDSENVLANGSVGYQLTPENLGLIKAMPVPPGVASNVFDAVAAATQAAGYKVYASETEFNAMLVSAFAGITVEQQRVFQRFAGMLSPNIGDWLFRLSPRNWNAPLRNGPKGTQLIFKFIRGRSLEELIADTSSWSWAEASSADGVCATASKAIQAIIQDARDADANALLNGLPQTFRHFLKMVDDPYWTGVLALSVEVPLDSLPTPLQALAAGIDPAAFYAHHVGLSSTSFKADNGQLTYDVTSSFGLIDYRNPEDQYFSSEIAFAFRVQQLTVGFENGKLAQFTSTVQLMVNRMFGCQTRLFPSAHGNNLILDGVYQSERTPSGGDRDTYVFALRDVGAFQLPLGQLREVSVDSTRLVTLRASDPASGNTTVTAAFQLAGRLRFDEPAQFDPFCWGQAATVTTSDAISLEDDDSAARTDGLLYSNYAITMSFPLGAPDKLHFYVAETDLALDPANSRARDNSLFSRFPLRLTGLLSAATAGAGLDPDAAGFISVSAPLQQGKLTQPWYGLVYEVDLGTLGALAGSIGLTVRLLAAWSPAGGEKGLPAVYFGVALPGVERMLGVSLPLQGILDIGFRAIQFTTYTDTLGRRQYLMRLRDFGLHVLGLSFPPGHNDIVLFGNPDQTSNTKLGWYAAYDDGKDDASSQQRSKTLDSPTPRKAPHPRASGQTIRTARPARNDKEGR